MARALLLVFAVIGLIACAPVPSRLPFRDDVLAERNEPPIKLAPGTPIVDEPSITVAAVVARAWLDGYAKSQTTRPGRIGAFCFRVEAADPPAAFFTQLSGHPAGILEPGSQCTFAPDGFFSSTGTDAARLLLRDIKVDGDKASVESMSGLIMAKREFCGCQVLSLLEKRGGTWTVTDEIAGICY